MTTITREKMNQRINADDGDKTDTVWVTGQTNKQTYHTKLTCRQCDIEKREYNPITRGRAQDNGQPPCKICVLGGRDVDKYTTGGKSKLERLIEAGEIDV